MLNRLQCTFCLNQNNVNDYIKPCTRQSLNCMHGIMLCPGITLALATPLAISSYMHNKNTLYLSQTLMGKKNIDVIGLAIFIYIPVARAYSRACPYRLFYDILA